MPRLALLLAVTTLATAAPPSITVAQDSLALPVGCSPRETASIVSAFLDAYNRSDTAALERYLAPEGDEPPGFQWLTLDQGGVHLRSGAVPYLLALRRSGLALELREIDLGRSWVRRSVGIGYRLRQTLNGQATTIRGKGEVHCPSKTIYVWSMATQERLDGDTGDAIVVRARAGHRPNAQEVVPELDVGSTTVQLPPRCAAAAVQARLLRLLRAFNLGDGKAGASNFARTGGLMLYTADRHRAVGRPAITSRIESRAAAGDGLTLVALRPPSNISSTPGRAVYGLTLRVKDTVDAGVKLVVDCGTGLLTQWVGPAIGAPG